jgi:DNA primase
MQTLTKEEYDDYCSRYKKVWKYLNDVSYEEDSVIQSICDLRGYDLESNMPNMLKEIGFVFIDEDLFDEIKLLKISRDLGIYTNKNTFLLKGRYIFPVKDMLGNIVALIGWYPDDKKYITTPSKFFKKGCMLFGMEQLEKTGIGKDYILVEGIFDCISVRSLGINCVALMGIKATNYTKVLYTLFKGIVAIPDNDKEGRKVIVNDAWKLPVNGKYFKWVGSLKDIDDMIKYYDMKDILKDIWKEKERVVTLEC